MTPCGMAVAKIRLGTYRWQNLVFEEKIDILRDFPEGDFGTIMTTENDPETNKTPILFRPLKLVKFQSI